MPGAIIVVYTLVVFMSCCPNCVYVCTPAFIATIAIIGPVTGIFIHFKERLPEAICCCLQTCNVDVVFLVIYCMYTPAVTTADISQLWVYYCLRLLVVYKLVILMLCCY